MLKLFINHLPVPVHRTEFPAGESGIRIADTDSAYERAGAKDAYITFQFRDNGDLIDLFMLTDAIRRHYRHDIPITLRMDYLPYARQDRVCNPGEALAVKVVADLINMQRYKRVICTDLHSDVAGAVLQRLEHIDLVRCLGKRAISPDTILVAPDAGAVKKVEALARAAGVRRVVRADKTRDLATGAITATHVHCEHVGNANFLVVDDICDGGATFIGLAQQLRALTTGHVELYVSHGLFTKGMRALEGLYDHIYTANLMAPTHPLITELTPA